ncbi:MAG TPA: M12 family metallo-peptidase [Phycisphaerales bacterium]|nr:M12 family metallo-peptidase [Phycisphaerales bacterium]HRQ76553.1 M12 family metallo-peptidase [Phycisphaerales bacterium]
MKLTDRRETTSLFRFVALGVTTAALVAVGTSFAGSSTDRGKAASTQLAAQERVAQSANQILGLLKSETIHLDLEAIHANPHFVAVPVAGELRTLELWPDTVRHANYTVWAQQADGSMVELEPQPVNTVSGVVVGDPGSNVAGSMHGGGLFLSIVFSNGENYWIEPLHGRVPGAAPGAHTVYNKCDVLPNEGVCGVTEMMEMAAWQPGEDDPVGEDGGIAGTVCRIAEVAVDADFQFYQLYGNSVANVENRVNAVFSTLNQQYESQVGIRHVIVHIIVRTSSASNPYSSNNASTLLNQFQSVWTSAPESSIPRDVAHLFTGRNLGNTLGIAWLGAICSFNIGYGLVVNRNNFSCATDLSAHELGHNWNAGHCSCPSFTMNPSLVCANNFNDGSINTIIAFRNTRTCLHNCPPPGPENNLCSGTILVGEGVTNFSNIGATTNGPNEPNLCNLGGDTQVQSDVWFGHIAQCTGELTMSLCGSSYATKIAAYFGSCPTQPDTAIGCDRTGCPTSTRSELTISVNQGQSVRIRIGGHNGAQGNGVLTITCTPVAPSCPADLTGDGNIDVSDLLILLGSWGPCAGCPADITGDNNVDVSDLLALLGAWGPCP